MQDQVLTPAMLRSNALVTDSFSQLLLRCCELEIEHLLPECEVHPFMVVQHVVFSGLCFALCA